MRRLGYRWAPQGSPVTTLRRMVLGVAGASCLLLAQPPATLAEADPAPGFGLQVTPARMVVPAAAISAAQRFQVTNRGRSSFDVTVEKADFVADVHGTMTFQPQAPYAAAAWVSVRPSRLRIPAGVTREVTVRMAVPAHPEPGDHQLALIFKVPAGRNAANIRINRAIAAPVFITVPGRIDRSVEIENLRAPRFVMGGPVDIITRIRDTGTVHRDFRGFGGRLHVKAGENDLTFPDFTVLRGSSREVATRWNPPLICFCHAVVSIPGTEKSATVEITVFPLHLLAILVLLILVSLSIGLFVQSRYRAKVLAAAASMNSTRDGHDF